MDPPKAQWEILAAGKLQSLLEAIPKEWIIPQEIIDQFDKRDSLIDIPHESKVFTSEELEYTDSSATVLVQKLCSGKWSSEAITRAFCKRAAIAHQLFNCLSEIMFDTAIEDAKKLDIYFREKGPIGPLHGLPISLKDNLHVKGKDSTIGFVSLIGKPAETDSPLVEMLRDAGAVVYVKTQTPTAMMIAETVNHICGTVHNPLRKGLTCGGSSGGEACLIAFGGSPLGVGSDIGGSLRIPASCCGIFTIRPSFGRFPTLHTQSGLGGQEAIQSVNGPMSKTLDDLELYCKAVIDGQPWFHDPRCIEMPWRERTAPAKLKIAVMWNDGIVIPTPPVTRALETTVEVLKTSGHEVFDWKPIFHQEGVELVRRIFLSDGGKSVKKLLDPVDEPLRPEMKDYGEADDIGVHEMWQIHKARVNICKQYLERWKAAKIDVLLCPTTPHSTCPHNSYWYVGYTAMFNLLDYSAVSFPTGICVDKTVDGPYPVELAPLNEVDQRIRDTYKLDQVDGMPISLQLVAGRLQEEILLSTTKTVLAALKEHAMP